MWVLETGPQFSAKMHILSTFEPSLQSIVYHLNGDLYIVPVHNGSYKEMPLYIIRMTDNRNSFLTVLEIGKSSVFVEGWLLHAHFLNMAEGARDMPGISSIVSLP